MMTEKFLQYIWFNKLFSHEQITTDGQKIDIIDIGQMNTDAGADVFNAKIKIGDTLWAGNVEFHTCASDWKRHNHHTDHAYNAVILHVVLKNDDTAIRANQTTVPQLVINYPKHIEERFRDLEKMFFIPCEDKLIKNRKNDLTSVFDKLLRERLENRAIAIENLLNQTSNDWEEAFYITTARSFGFGTNTDTFESLAKRLPQKILAKHRNNQMQIEALLFGTGGFLEQDIEDEYFVLLKNEFAHLRRKYGLTPIPLSQWKQFRIRPTNFPTVRIAQFANLICKSTKLFSQIIEIQSYSSFIKYYRCTPSEYWTNHYRFGSISEIKTKNISKPSIDILLINSTIPFIYTFGKKFNRRQLIDLAPELLRQIPAENNRITKEFAKINIVCNDAFQSQALYELKTRYCDTKSCFLCKNRFNLW